MSKINLFESGILHPEIDDGNIVSVTFTFEGNDEEPVYIGTGNPADNANGKAAISAYADLLSNGVFDHPLTDMVLGTIFIRDTANLDAFYASEIGFITDKSDAAGFPRVTRNLFPEGVACLHRRNGKFFATNPGRSAGVAQVRYVDWMQAAVQQRNLKVRTRPFQEWITTVLGTLSIEDPKERRATRDENIAAAVDKKQVSRQVGKGLRQLRNGDDSVLKSEILVTDFLTGEPVDMLEKSVRTVLIHTSRGDTHPRIWDRSGAAMLAFQAIGARKGWSVELDPDL
jgi:hypothetical protein